MDSKNVILALALSFAVLLGWQYFYVQPQLEAEQARIEAQQRFEAERAATGGAPAPGAVPGAVPQPQTLTPAPDGAAPEAPADTAAAPPVPAAGAPAQPAATAATRAGALAASPRVEIDTPRLSGSINLTGARLDDLRLKDYHETVDRSSPTIVLLSPSGTPGATYAETGWVSVPGGPAMPNASTVWSVEGAGPLTPSTPVTLTWDNDAGLTFRRTFSVDENYMFTVTQSVENQTGAPVTVYPYSLVARQGTPVTSGFFILHEGLIGVFGEDGLREVSYSSIEDDGTIALPQVSNGWLGITDKYWATAVVPVAGTPFEPRFVYDASRGFPQYQADYLGAPLTIAPGGSGEYLNRVFAGAKEVDVIQGYEEAIPVEKFDLLIDWGWFYFITRPLFYTLDYIYKIVGNFGVAILIVTVLVKMLFFPLANKAYVSMSKMKKLQPEMLELRERYKDDRMKQQQAMMELYKKEKVNPLAGCIPIVIQIPVFFALYKVLFVTIEMRHAPFFGWIEDLAAPDPTSIFNLFGLLPYDPAAVPLVGAFLMVGLWPLIMGVTMWVQMKMNPAPPDKTQAMIFNWMPVFFTFLLASFPAGLVIYWAWNNTLSVAQQYVIMRRQGVKVELWDNLIGLFRRKQGSTPT